MTNIRGILGKVTQESESPAVAFVGKTESWLGYNYPGSVMALDAC